MSSWQDASQTGRAGSTPAGGGGPLRATPGSVSRVPGWSGRPGRGELGNGPGSAPGAGSTSAGGGSGQPPAPTPLIGRESAGGRGGGGRRPMTGCCQAAALQGKLIVVVFL